MVVVGLPTEVDSTVLTVTRTTHRGKPNVGSGGMIIQVQGIVALGREKLWARQSEQRASPATSKG